MGIGDVLPRLMAGARRRRLPIAPLLAVSPAAIYLAIIYVFPVVRILVLSLFDPGFTLEHYRRLIEVPIYRNVMLNTVEISISVSLLCLLLAYPAAYLLVTIRPQISQPKPVGCALSPRYENGIDDSR